VGRVGHGPPKILAGWPACPLLLMNIRKLVPPDADFKAIMHQIR